MRSIDLTRTAHVDSISLSATNAAGGTRVIGVGCRYYTTLRRGVFILQLRLRRSLNGRTYVSYTICAICAGWSRATPSIQISVWLYHLRYLRCTMPSLQIKGLICRLCRISWGLRYLYRLLYKCLAVCPVLFVAIFVGRCILCEVTLSLAGDTTALRVPIGGII